MKVAQHKVLGKMIQKEMSVPLRDDRNARPSVSRIRIHKRKQPSVVPSGTVALF
jgi:hypothetical protein